VGLPQKLCRFLRYQASARAEERRNEGLSWQVTAAAESQVQDLLQID
jgi:hypothetical protein